MIDLFAAHLHSKLVEACVAVDLRLQVDVASLCEHLNQDLEDDIGGDALREQLINSISHFLKLLRRLLSDDLISSLVEELLPVYLRHFLGFGERILLDFAGFQHEDGSSQISLRLFGNVLCELSGQLEVLFAANVVKDVNDVLVRRSWNSNAEATALDGWNYSRGGIDAQDEAACGHIFFHHSTQSVLGVFSELVDFREHYNSKVPLAVDIYKVCLGNLLDYIGNNHSVVDSGIRWIY